MTFDYKDLRGQDPSSLPAKERILRSAIILFNRDGVHSTGIDKIIEESNVAKMTFYKHFPAKLDLISAYLQFKHDARFCSLQRHTTDKSSDPYKQILGIFDALEEWFEEPDFNGCPFVRGMTDFNERKEPQLCSQVAAHFAQWSSFLEERLAKVVKPTKVAPILLQLITLIIGSIAVALATKDPQVASVNKKLAESLLGSAEKRSGK